MNNKNKGKVLKPDGCMYGPDGVRCTDEWYIEPECLEMLVRDGYILEEVKSFFPDGIDRIMYKVNPERYYEWGVFKRFIYALEHNHVAYFYPKQDDDDFSSGQDENKEGAEIK